MQFLATITLLVLAIAMVQPGPAQSFKPDWKAGFWAYYQKDFATALRHWRPLADQGDSEAQFWLGKMHGKGKGVTKDYKEAVRLYRLAANQGNSSAQWWLGESYGDGEGVVQDLIMAYVWFNVAVSSGNNNAKTRRDKTFARLNASERKLARKLSKFCLKKLTKCPEYSVD